MKPTIAQVVAVLELLIRYHSAGMALLLRCEPTSDEISEIVCSLGSGDDLCVRVMGGAKLSQQERATGLVDTITWILDSVGGWENIHRAAEDYRRIMGSDVWREATDYVVHIRPGGILRDGHGGYGRRFFGPKGKHGIHPRTARRRFRDLLRVVVTKALSFYDFDLSGDMKPVSPS